MNRSSLRHAATSTLHPLKTVWLPPRRLEYIYFFIVSYSTLAAFLGVEIPLIAAGLITFLAVFCFFKTGSTRREIYEPIALLIACQISHVLVQVIFHDVFILSDSLRWFILWTFATLIVQSLCLRPGFLYRCTAVIFTIGLIAVPSLGFNVDTVERARAGIEIGGGLQNPNGLAAWFGFCAVSFGVAAIEKRHTNIWRLAYFAAAIISLFIVALTVSRGALLGCAVAMAVGSRQLLKRAFFPLLVFILLVWLIFESGLINHLIYNYEARATEETGRFILWPYVIDRIWQSPLIGVGITRISTDIQETGGAISTPHNSFLFLALSSGIVPFAFFLAFWIRAVKGSLRDTNLSEYGPFRAPLLLYALISVLLADISAELWSVVALAVVAGPPIFLRRRSSLVSSRIRARRFNQETALNTEGKLNVTESRKLKVI